MAGLCEGGNEPTGSLKARFCRVTWRIWGRSLSVPECIAGSIGSRPLRVVLRLLNWLLDHKFAGSNLAEDYNIFNMAYSGGKLKLGGSCRRFTPRKKNLSLIKDKIPWPFLADVE
ncbi:hypothetical protein ANN_24325 [Periplaneta americana]|uniref:Uncharacterized protein n=1 Tax=Periplaneta americana TaxID=6978 RepID=A0ABQ8S2R9_PERAM|nr:hypothetical protein ANN_24325 [Periplaneta americana]